MSEPTRFIPGGAPGPGRPKGSVGGRAQAIALIDQIISENADDLRAALLQAFKKNPVSFWTRYGFPLVPQALVAKVETTPATHHWSSLRETIAEDEGFRRELQALRNDFPGQDARILGMIANGIPPGALRIQMGGKLRPAEDTN